MCQGSVRVFVDGGVCIGPGGAWWGYRLYTSRWEGCVVTGPKASVCVWVSLMVDTVCAGARVWSVVLMCGEIFDPIPSPGETSECVVGGRKPQCGVGSAVYADTWLVWGGVCPWCVLGLA